MTKFSEYIVPDVDSCLDAVGETQKLDPLKAARAQAAFTSVQLTRAFSCFAGLGFINVGDGIKALVTEPETVSAFANLSTTDAATFVTGLTLSTLGSLLLIFNGGRMGISQHNAHKGNQDNVMTRQYAENNI